MNPAYAIAILGAALYGSADFLGGFASRRASSIAVTFAAGIPGLLVLLVALPFTSGTPVAADHRWAVAAGLCGSLGVALLYRAFAVGPVSVAAPLISLVALTIPVAAGVLEGERPSLLVIAGIALAAAAFPLLARSVESTPSPRESRVAMIPLALLSGVLVGAFLLSIGRLSPGAGLVPLLTARITMLVLFAILLTLRRQSFFPTGAAFPTAFAGILDSFANIAYFVAVSRAPMTVVSTIVSLAPAATVLLARLVLREHWTPSQRAGLALATAAIVCVSMG